MLPSLPRLTKLAVTLNLHFLHLGPGVYGKIFAQIFDSSIAEDYQLRLVFQDMIILADINGVVDMTVESLSRRTNVPIEIVRKAITELELPDSKSRTPEHQGARIKRLDEHRDWGWMILNYETFRKIASAEQRREKTAERVRNFKARKRLTLGNAGNAMQKEKHKQMEGEVPPSFPQAKRWQINKDVEALRARAKEIRTDGGQTFDGTRWHGHLAPDKRVVVDNLNAEIKTLKSLYDAAPN